MSVWSWAYVVVLALLVPTMSARSLRSGAGMNLPRRSLYGSICASLWVLAALGFLVVKLDGQTLADVFVTAKPFDGSLSTFLVWTLLLAAAGLLLFALSHRLRPWLGMPAEEEALQRLRPTDPVEIAWILLIVSPTAGVCEEFLYRGFLVSRIALLVGSRGLAAVLAAGVFGAAHSYQGRLGAARAGIIA
ncbi:MAG TPA: CPBP family intramembrane glutamic endopeptidase, partial [Patescibacteria group bacterium]|nr:CPBP family intramembrane glutamic endopeptidase [Patescibacteria group bacterium]